MDDLHHWTKRQHSHAGTSDTDIDYWGFGLRVWPCVRDAGTCEYFEAIYRGHEIGIIFVGVLVASLLGLVFLFAACRQLWFPRRASETPSSVVAGSEFDIQYPQSSSQRLFSTLCAARRHTFLPESPHRSIFGRTTRLQVTILAVFTGYLTIFSFAGITYKSWRTPVRGQTDMFETRSSLGPWSDRIGTLAYALTPFSVLLASRESILSLLTGIPYQSFNFLHRWLGYIIFAQGLLHTIGWTLIETVFYQPQPSVAQKWIVQEYMIWGCVAIILITLLFVLSLPPVIRMTGYEFFRKSHYVLAMVYIGACWGHWKLLKSLSMHSLIHHFTQAKLTYMIPVIPALSLWFFDRFARLMRMALIHYQYLPDGSLGFVASQAHAKVFPDTTGGDIIRLDITPPQQPWKIGQHFYLCFPALSIWQSHPFTPLSLPEVDEKGRVKHAYLIRARSGLTKRMAGLRTDMPTSVIMQGAYGEDLVECLTPDVNVLAVAGGTGITYVLPVLLWLAKRSPVPDRKISLIWAVRKARNVEWIAPELEGLMKAAEEHGIEIHVHATREDESQIVDDNDKTVEVEIKAVSESSASSSSSSSPSRRKQTIRHKLGRPDLTTDVREFVEGTVRRRTEVFASGPGELISELRGCVAALNRPGEVWNGRERFDVSLRCDDRMEW